MRHGPPEMTYSTKGCGHDYNSPRLPLAWSLSCRCVPLYLWPKHLPLHSPWCGTCLCRRGRRGVVHEQDAVYPEIYSSHLDQTEAETNTMFEWTHTTHTMPNLLLWWVWCHQLATRQMSTRSPWWQVQLEVSLLLRYLPQWLWCLKINGQKSKISEQT